MKISTRYGQVLGHAPFRRYFLGEGVSSLGDSMSEVTIIVLALHLATGDFRPVAVALASAAYLVPGILTGVLAGRRLGAAHPRTLLLIDNAWRGSWLGLAALLATTERLGLGGFVTLLGLASLTRPLGAAGSRGLVTELVADEELFAANSLVNSTVQATVMLGPAAAGLLATLIGAGPVLAIDALSFLFFVVALLAVRTEPRHASPTGEQVPLPSARLAKRWRWAGWLAGYPAITSLIVLTGIFHALYGPFVVGLPLLVEERAGGLPAASVLGLLWSAFGVGAVIGGLITGNRVSIATPRAASLIAAGWGAATVIVAVPAPIGLAGAAMLAGGVVYAPYIAIVNTVMQQELPPPRLAEASAYYSSVTSVAGPLGTLAGGAVVAAVGASVSLLGTGTILIAVGLLAAAFGPQTRAAAITIAASTGFAATEDSTPSPSGWQGAL